jgi:hypothetical protein
MTENTDTSPLPRGNGPIEPIPMFRNRYFIGAVVAFIVFVIISFSGLKPTSEMIVKTLGVVLVIGTVAWFIVKPWK